MKTIAVIGCGPGGLVAVKELKAKGFSVTAFDQQDSIGGVFSHPGAANGVYDELTLNTSRAFSEYSDFPWNKEDFKSISQPDEGGVFASCHEFKAYLLAYAKHFDLEANCQLNTGVKEIKRKDNGSGFLLTTTKSSTPLEFDAVVMCTGRNGRPNHVLKDALKPFSGQVQHIFDVKSLSDYDGKRVLVIGGSVSGSDFSSKLASRGKCKSLVNSTRRTPYLIDKFNTEGQAADVFLFIRLVAWIKSSLPEFMAFSGLKANVLQNCPEQLDESITKNPMLGAPDPDIRKAGVSYTSGYYEAVKSGTLIMKPGFKSVDKNTVTFADDSGEEFDVIIAATGHLGWDLSILPNDIEKDIKFEGPTNFEEPALYKRTLVPNVPDLAFIGTFNIGSTCPLVEMQARYVASVFNGDVPRPSETKIKTAAEAHKQLRMLGPHNRFDVTVEIQEDIGCELGVTPTMWQAFRNPSSLLLGQMYPCYYRMNPDVDGEKVAEKAKERWEWCHAHPMKKTDTN